MLNLDLIPPIPNTNMMTIDDLKRIRDLKKAIDNSSKAIDNINYEILPSSIFNNIKVSSSSYHDKTLNKLVKIEEQRDSIMYYLAQKTEEVEGYILKAISIINLIPSHNQQDILIMRYIDCLTWDQICDKKDCYSPQAQMRLMRRAQKSFIEVQSNNQ